MKVRETLFLLFLGLAISIAIYFRPLVIQQQVDYILPADKTVVEQVINEYYKEVGTIEIQPKRIKAHQVNIRSQELIDKIAEYIKKKEGFSAKAYKDNTQYTNGYGTAATSPEEVITKIEAEKRLYRHIKTVIIPSFDKVIFQSTEQVYAAIDFSYNLGHNRFLQKIVREDGYIDCSKMMAYNKVRNKEGKLVYNEGLAKRRFENFLECAAYEIVEN